MNIGGIVNDSQTKISDLIPLCLHPYFKEYDILSLDHHCHSRSGIIRGRRKSPHAPNAGSYPLAKDETLPEEPGGRSWEETLARSLDVINPSRSKTGIYFSRFFYFKSWYVRIK
jgi:hypothetical protein